MQLILYWSRHNNSGPHCLFLENMTTKQWLKIKSSIVDTNNWFNGIFLSFDSLNLEFFPGFRLIDNFSSWFSFYKANCKDKTAYLCKLNNIFSNISLDSNFVIVVFNTSIRNNVAMSILHIYSHSNNVKKTIYYAINIILTEVKLSAIRYGINQVIQISEVTHIIVITNAIYLAQHIFDSMIHLYQLQSIAIVKNLRIFFNKHPINSINFWNYPSNVK